MALTLQRKLELAGDLAKVRPMLQRLHLVEKPKERHHVRNVILVSSAIGAGALIVVTVLRRRGRNDGAGLRNGDEVQSDSLVQDSLPTDFDQSVIPDVSVHDPA